MKKFTLVLALGAPVLLGGCSGTAITGAVVAPAIAAGLGVSQTTLSDVSIASCATQNAANAAARIAHDQGSLVWASRFKEISSIAGFGCIW